jgi:hypothetical protein
LNTLIRERYVFDIRCDGQRLSPVCSCSKPWPLHEATSIRKDLNHANSKRTSFMQLVGHAVMTEAINTDVKIPRGFQYKKVSHSWLLLDCSKFINVRPRTTRPEPFLNAIKQEVSAIQTCFAFWFHFETARGIDRGNISLVAAREAIYVVRT